MAHDARFGNETTYQALLQWATVLGIPRHRLILETTDLVQDTIKEAIESPRQFGELSDEVLHRYLCRTLRNNLIDAFRRVQRNPVQASIEAWATSTNRLEFPDDGSSPSEQVLRSERFARLAEALDRLPDRQRMAVELRFLNGATGREIADLLDCSVEAVDALVHRAVIALRNDVQLRQLI